MRERQQGLSKIESRKQLLVEGRDCQEFFKALVAAEELAGDIQIQNFGGVNELGKFVAGFRKAPGFDKVVSIGIVRDAEDNAERAFQSVCTALAQSQFPEPEKPLIKTRGFPSLTVMILPDAVSPGMLEDLCWRAVNDMSAVACVEQYLECVREAGNEPKPLAKARLHTYLAAQSTPGLRLGQAAHRGYFPWESLELDQVKKFVRSL